jgi:intracellular multiplication protein IcmP
MAKKGGGQPQPESNNEILLAGAIAIFVFLGWFLLHTKIATFILFIRGLEMSVIALVTDQLDPLRTWMSKINRAAVTLKDIWLVSNSVGAYVRWLTTPFLIGMGYWLYNNSPTERFRRTYTDRTLPTAVADLFPWMKISTKIDFSTMDPEVGPWAFAETERMFARKHKIKNERGEFDPVRAEQVFVKQFGNMWINYKNLKPHAKALFAMLAARLNKDFKTSDLMLRQLGFGAAEGTMNYDGVDELAAKYMDTKPVKRILRQHAYESTVLMQMLDQARGKKDYLPPNWFLWLKGVDRRLWYSLADVGRHTVHVESAGVFAHWLTERARKKSLQMPFVLTAVAGLESELKKLTDDGDMELSDDLDDLEINNATAIDIPSPEEAELLRAQRAIQGGAGGGTRIEED